MTDMEVRDLLQDAVYWAPSGVDNYGDDKLATGIALKVRWQTKSGEVVDAFGNTIATDSVVAVGQAVEVGGILWKGKLADLPSPVTGVTDLKEIVTYDEVPDVKNRATRRVVKLMKHSDKLPTLA